MKICLSYAVEYACESLDAAWCQIELCETSCEFVNNTKWPAHLSGKVARCAWHIVNGRGIVAVYVKIVLKVLHNSIYYTTFAAVLNITIW